MKKIVLLCLSFNFFFFGCRKEPQTQRLDPTGMKYIQLRPNQFFIYKDSASGKTDSVVVTESVLTTVVGGGNEWLGTPNYEKYSLTLTKKGGAGDSVWVQGTAYGSYLNQIQLEGYFFYPVYAQSRDFYMMPSCSIEGVAYSDVIVANKVFTDFTCVYYWAPLVGLIKVTKTDSSLQRQTFTLLRHN